MKKILKILVKVLVVAVLLLILADLGLHLLARTPWFEDRMENALQSAFGRAVDLGPMSANLSGVSVRDIQIAEKGGFENGTFVQARRLRVRLSLIHLLRAHIRINAVTLSGATARLTVYKDGTTSWADWVGAPEPAPTTPSTATASVPFQVTVRHLRLEDLRLIYQDQQTPRTLEISGLTLSIKHFRLDKEFTVHVIAQFFHREPDFERTVPLTLKARVNLAQLDGSLASVQVEHLKAYYKNSVISLRGSVHNFTNPHADIQVTVRNLSSQMLPSLPPAVTFDLPRADLSANLTADMEKQTLTVHRASLQAPGVDVQAQGRVGYAGPLQYKFSAQANWVLGEIGRWLTNVAEPYRLVGTLQSNVTVSQQASQAQITLQDIGALIPGAGRMANVNGKIDVQESMDFKTGQADANIEGKLNASPFTLSLQAAQTPQKIAATLDAYAQEVILPALEEKSATEEQSGPEVSSSAQNAWSLPPIELKSKIQVDKLDVPYFLGQDILFTSNVEGLTPDLNQAHGTLHLTTGSGTIQDIYKLTDANPLTKVLFLSLNVTGKVFNSLNVLGVLNSLGSGVVSAVTGGSKEEEKPVKTQTILGPDGQPLEVVVEESDKEVSGKMEYDKFDTQVNFTHGLATVKEGTFVSPMMSFRLDGTADFNTGALNMKVHAAPGRHEVDGMLPLLLKIGGTVDNPQGDMQVLGSVTSLVTQTVTNNVVSRNVTKGIKGIFGLFKKKEEPAPAAVETSTSPDID